jgi:transcription elongation factor Elf1
MLENSKSLIKKSPPSIKSQNQSLKAKTYIENKFSIDGVLEEKVKDYNEFVLSKRKMWRIPENELKVYIVKNNLIPHECKFCKIKPLWRDKPLDLILDRKNNEILDNELENLRFVCPNCLSQQKNKSSIFEKSVNSKMVKCKKCNKRIKYKTFSLNKETNIEQYCTVCLKQERLEALISSKKYLEE